jgi:pentatricopeptide repeat protein
MDNNNEQNEQKRIEEVQSRFHDDMRRVLESRRHFLKGLVADSRLRMNRPVTLDSDLDGAERVLTMLRHLKDIHAANEESYQIVMQAFLRRYRIRWSAKDDKNHPNVIVCAADQLEELLNELLKVTNGSNVSMETYNLVLEAYAVCSTPRREVQYAGRAEELLERMKAIFGSVSVESKMFVLHAHAWQQENLAEGLCAERAHEMLDQIEQETEDPAIIMQGCAWVLEAWSKSASVGSAEKVEALFLRLKDLNETVVSESTLLDAETYSNAILGWSKSVHKGAPERSNELLLEMVDQYRAGSFPPGSEPPLIAFNGVISAWGRVGRPDKADKILRLMEKVRLTCSDLTPDAVSYNSVIHAYLRGDDKNKVLQKVLSLVKFMEENEDERPCIKPNTFTYNTLVKFWIQSRHPDFVEESERALAKMQILWQQGDRDVIPSNRVFNMVINAYAKSRDPAATTKAMDLLTRMKSIRACHPDQITYTSVLECLSKSSDPKAPEKAEALLEEAFGLYNETGYTTHMPNLRTFTMAISTYANNNGNPQKARNLLTRLVDFYQETKDPQLRPNEYPYNYVLNCAANSLEPTVEAFRIASETFQEMRKSDLVKPDSFTYGFWLKCCNNLLPEGDLRTKCVSYAVDEAKNDGFVSQELLTRLFQGSSRTLVNELLEIENSHRNLQVDTLPPAWSRNLRRSSPAKLK